MLRQNTNGAIRKRCPTPRRSPTRPKAELTTQLVSGTSCHRTNLTSDPYPLTPNFTLLLGGSSAARGGSSSASLAQPLPLTPYNSPIKQLQIFPTSPAPRQVTLRSAPLVTMTRYSRRSITVDLRVDPTGSSLPMDHFARHAYRSWLSRHLCVRATLELFEYQPRRSTNESRSYDVRCAHAPAYRSSTSQPHPRSTR
jgi:hypothetical protein